LDSLITNGWPPEMEIWEMDGGNSVWRMCYEVTLISLLRLWTHNRPSPDSPQLSYDICDTTRPYCDITRPHSNFVLTPGTATCVMPHHLMFGIAGRTAPCVTPRYQLSAQRLRSVAMSCITIYGIQRFNFRMARPLRPPLSQILLVLQTFLASCRCFTILFSYFRNSLCFLLATDRLHFPFYLALFYYKNPCT
jgi:hypothetical protein